jgi:hypothetical protein
MEGSVLNKGSETCSSSSSASWACTEGSQVERELALAPVAIESNYQSNVVYRYLMGRNSDCAPHAVIRSNCYVIRSEWTESDSHRFWTLFRCAKIVVIGRE